MKIAELIREYLKAHPEGGLTKDIAAYCLRNGAIFNTSDINKSVAGQLSKMRSNGEITFLVNGKYYIWKSLHTLKDKYYK